VLAAAADVAAGPTRAYTGVSDDELVGVLTAWQRTESWAAAGRLSAAAELIRRRPATGRARAGRAGVPLPWGKFCADELAAALAMSRWAAEKMTGLAHDLAARLPLTRQALHDGIIDAYKAQVIAEATRCLDAAAAAAAEAAVVPDRVTGKTPGQLKQTLTILKSLRNTVHGQMLRSITIQGSAAIRETAIRLPGEHEAAILAAMDAMGGRIIWGVRTAAGSSVVDPGVLVEQLFPHVMTLLNEVMEATPVERLGRVTLTAADALPPQEGRSNGGPGIFDEKNRLSFRWQLGL
jgi:hypothetical protein